MDRAYIKNILRENLLIEGLSDVVYHFTTIDNAPGILKNDAIKAAPIFSEEEIEDDDDFSKGKYYYISTTSTKDPKSGYQNTLRTMGEDLVCFNLNGRAISERYKSVRVDYFSKAGNSDKKVDEMEDRIIMDDPELGPLSKYVLEVHVQYHDDKAQKALYIQKKAEEVGVPVYFYSEEKDFAAQNKDKAIDISSGTSEEADERSAISSLERNPTITTKFLLALSIYNDDRLRQRLEDQLSEIEGIERILRKEGVDSIDKLFKNSIQDFESELTKFENYSEDVLLKTLRSKVLQELNYTKSVSKDPLNRAIMHNFILSMKRQNTNKISEYLRNKLGIGEKQTD